VDQATVVADPVMEGADQITVTTDQDAARADQDTVSWIQSWRRQSVRWSISHTGGLDPNPIGLDIGIFLFFIFLFDL